MEDYRHLLDRQAAPVGPVRRLDLHRETRRVQRLRLDLLQCPSRETFEATGYIPHRQPKDGRRVA